MSKKFKKLTIFGCPLCMGDPKYCTLINRTLKDCIKSKQEGFFYEDKNKPIDMDKLSKMIINNSKI